MNCGTRAAALWYVDSVGCRAGSATSEMQLSVVPTKPPRPLPLLLSLMLLLMLCAADASFLRKEEEDAPLPELAAGCCWCCCGARGPSSKQKVSPQISKILPPSEVERPWSRGKLRPLAGRREARSGPMCQSGGESVCVHAWLRGGCKGAGRTHYRASRLEFASATSAGWGQCLKLSEWAASGRGRRKGLAHAEDDWRPDHLALRPAHFLFCSSLSFSCSLRCSPRHASSPLGQRSCRVVSFRGVADCEEH